jgi:hypothetical protein
MLEFGLQPVPVVFKIIISTYDLLNYPETG